ncbi:MAG TPA: hypothetical protein VEA80_08820 [Vitreimonas sp.]|uniref:hypothetical protein n=1 Tax=Vitreimonas sp. TaxID=3069702 RepID=UPI002D4EA227|nr:hypothetical protein [Vitreimonas sp.]HYD87562.1 hypothetical protein [Vitreimonas sp.]
MNDEKLVVEQGFYQACAELLGAEHDYRPFPFRRRTRWNNRAAGNGRFPGFGVIRIFGDRVHMQLRAPAAVNRWFASQAEALAHLRALVGRRGEIAA